MVLAKDTYALSPFSRYDIAQWISDLARWRGSSVALIWLPFEGRPVSWTYQEFLHEVSSVAGGLGARGINQGDRVLVHLENCPEAIFVRFACAWLGACCVSTNANAVGPELTFLADKVGAVAAVTQPRFADTLSQHCKGLKWIVCTEDDAGISPSRPIGRNDCYVSLRASPMSMREPDPGAVASIMFTTGTTSRPKGVQWTHANVLWGAMVNSLQQRLTPADVNLVFLPLFHVAGLSWNVLSTMWSGGTVVLQQKFSLSRFWPAALETRATVGAQVFFTVNALSSIETPTHHFRRWIMPRYDHAIMRRFGVSFATGWGMTEVITQATFCDEHMSPPDGTMGRPTSSYEIRVVDENNRDVELGQSGHLILKGIKGLSIFAGYDGDEAATDAAFDEDGYFRTGDRVEFGQNGWLRFGDRIKDVIKVGGEGVSASEIEAVVSSVQNISAVAVVAKPDPTYAEVPVAFVVPDSQCPRSEWKQLQERIHTACIQQLSKFKRPREIHFVPTLPTAGFGKISKVTLREWARNGPTTFNSKNTIT